MTAFHRRLVALQAIMNTCQFIALPFLALSFADVPGVGLTEAGLAVGVYLGVSRVGPLFTGPMADAIGLWHAVCAGLLLRGVSFALVPFVDSGGLAIAVAVLLGVGVAIYEPGIYGVMGSQEKEHRENLLMANVQALNIGCVIGPVLGFFAVLIAIDAAFWVAGSILIGLGVFCIISTESGTMQPLTSDVGAGIRRIVKDRNFLWLCLALVPFWALFAQLFAALPVLMAATSGNDALAGLVIFLNGVVGFVAVIWYRRLAQTRSTQWLLILGCLLGAVSTWCLGMPVGLIVLICVICVFSISESFVTTAADILAARHADGSATGSYFSILNASIGLGSAIGAPLGMWAISFEGPIGFVLIGLGGVVSALVLKLAYGGSGDAIT